MFFAPQAAMRSARRIIMANHFAAGPKILKKTLEPVRAALPLTQIQFIFPARKCLKTGGLKK